MDCHVTTESTLTPAFVIATLCSATLCSTINVASEANPQTVLRTGTSGDGCLVEERAKHCGGCA